jgi:hypothetical protein
LKLSLSNGIFSKLGINENFATVKQLGFQNVEFNMKSIKKERDTDVYREQKALAPGRPGGPAAGGRVPRRRGARGLPGLGPVLAPTERWGPGGPPPRTRRTPARWCP